MAAVLGSQETFDSEENADKVFKKLMLDPKLALEFEKRVNETERLHKEVKYSVYESDFKLADKVKMKFGILIFAVEALKEFKTTVNQEGLLSQTNVQ